MTNLLNFAKKYLDLGWSLVPIKPETKVPAIAWKEFQDRRPTLEEVEYWLNQKWQLAVVTGDISGILIVDDDRVKHGLNEWGFTSPVTAKTQSGGKHYYFTYNRELHSHSNANIRVDVKAWHSYCLLPPFNNREWVNPPSFENMRKLEPVDDETIRLINSDTKTADGERVKISMTDFLKVPEGGRTDALHKIACSVFTKYPKEEGIQILLGINETYTPPVTKEEFEYQVGRAYDFVQSRKDLIDGLDKPYNLQNLIDIRREERKLEINPPKTGIPTLDYMVKGFVPKHTYTMTGTTNVGKTSLACVFAVNVANQNKRVLYLALEPDTGVIEYIASIVKDKKFEDLDPETDYDFGDLPIEIYTKKQVRSPQKLLEILEKSERYDLVIIDHVGYFVKDASNINGDQANMMKVLAEIATSKLCSMLIIAHMRKPLNTKKDVMPTMDDISGSGSFKQDSTDVWIVHKNRDSSDTTGTKYLNTGFLLVAKSKNSASGAIPIKFGERKAGVYEDTIFNKNLSLDKRSEKVKNATVEEVSLFGEELFNKISPLQETSKVVN